MKTLRITLAAAVIAALFTGCGGAAGPEGPAGPTGAQGYQGVSGVTGTYAVGASNPADWQVSGSFIYASYSVSIITANADANGVIAVYFQTAAQTATDWAPLPDTYPSGGTETTLTYNYDIGTLVLQMQNANGVIPATPAAFNFKVVVIPTAVIKQHPGLNTKDYREVMQMLNLRS
jgi:hypothetical protein